MTDEDPTASERAQLLRAIEEAFAGVTREGGVSLHEAVVIDNYGSAEEQLEARRLDTDSHWEDVPDADIQATDAVLSFVDAIGFHYYVPAYMSWVLRHYPSSLGENCTSSLLFHLGLGVTPFASPTPQEYLEKQRFFTPPQARAICHFLRWTANEGIETDAHKAVEAYWGRRADDASGS